MTPKQLYQRGLADGHIMPDAAQADAIEHLDALFHRLVEAPPRREPATWWARWRKPAPCKPVRGLYMWGGVGRGKTFLMDTFYEALPFSEKRRMHFHRFMRHVHQSLRELQSVKNPLQTVAERIAEDTRVICFDEFFVTDITDAMLLAGLFESLFDLGVTLVATSNIVPQELYKDGLQRSRFLPAIALIAEHTEVINVDGGTAYRLRTLEQAELYHAPLDAGADQSLLSSFRQLAPVHGLATP
ncbi:cell division protein ZapE, partial [bacterium]|nr:cell division protein ZapE [bacterium]